MTTEYPKFDLQNPDTHPDRYYRLIFSTEELVKELSHEELKGAAKVLGLLSQELEHLHFEKKMVFNQKILVKTITEVYENVLEDALQKHQKTTTK
jgi:hypothetical protein